MRKPIITFENYTFQYRAQETPTLHNINLDIYEGERVIFVGASGCGKSTLAHCLNGLNPFSYEGTSEGKLTICGVDAGKAGIFELSRYVGTVLQDTDGQFIGMTVLEDIAFALENDNVAQEEMRVRVREEADKVGLVHKLEDAPHALSGGQKQRVSMAGVMIHKSPILLFDEPLANLDPAAGREAMELIDTIQKSTGTTVIIIEHRLEDALHMGADRIILMEGGRIKQTATPSELFRTNLLTEAGIREPLYITALKYAGVSLEHMELDKIQDIHVTEQQKELVRAWFKAAGRKPEPPAAEPILKVEGVSFGYTSAKENLTSICFTIGAGEMVSIVGKNGAGKSTLAKLLCGFERCNKGAIFLRGKNLEEDTIKERAQYIGYVMQNPNQMISQPMLYDEVALGLKVKGVPAEEIRERVEKTLKICGLYEFRNWPVQALSYGQKKRVTIAAILVEEPDILILDEPTAGQDFRHYTEIMEFLKGLNERGITVMMITHDMHLMLEYTQRTLVFADGRMIADTTPSGLFVDKELIRRASLKETSLYEIARMCGIDAKQYIDTFIHYDREVRRP